MWPIRLRLRRRADSGSTFPAPVSIVPSGEFHGNDGPWSTFPVKIGTPRQTVQSLISTASSQTWAVLPQGCQPANGVINCDGARGGSYEPTRSSTWEQNRAVYNGYFNLTLSAGLNISSVSNIGQYGLDTVTLDARGTTGLKLDKQLVAGIATKDYFLGLFGVNGRTQSLPVEAGPLPNYLASLNSSRLIPSMSWGYTAGNQYRNGGTPGSLTLGGFDSSRFVTNDLSFPITGSDARSLAIKIGQIVLTTEGLNDVIDTPGKTITAAIDSTTPYLIFPSNICAEFEFQFGLAWDPTSQLYLVNDTQHDTLTKGNTSVTFNIGNANTIAGQGLNITIPYAAFNLTASPPLTNESTRYFPLKRAANDSQITLGRTFLQETYLIADYERNNFSISQCRWDNISAQRIVAIFLQGEHSHASHHSLSGGAIAGIVIGAIAVLALIAGAILLFRQRRHRVSKTPAPPTSQSVMKIPELDSNQDPYALTAENKALPSPELDVIVHKGHELDAGGEPIPFFPQQQQQDGTAYELDATSRHSVTGSSPISPFTPHTQRFSHQRTLSDPSSIESGEDRTSELATSNSHRVSKMSHRRTLSDPSSVGESSQGGTVVEEPGEEEHAATRTEFLRAVDQQVKAENSNVRKA